MGTEEVGGEGRILSVSAGAVGRPGKLQGRKTGDKRDAGRRGRTSEDVRKRYRYPTRDE